MNATILRQLGFAALALCLFLVAGIAVTAYRDSQEFYSEPAGGQGNPQLTASTKDVTEALREAEASQSAYVQTGRASEQQRYSTAVARVTKDLGQIQAAAGKKAGKPHDASLQLSGLVTQKLAQLKRGMEARRRPGMQAATQPPAESQQLNENIAAVTAEIAPAESERAADALARLSAAARETWMATVAGCLMLLLLVGGSLYAMHVAFRQYGLLIARLTRSAEAADGLRDQWQSTLAGIGDGVLVTDVEGRITCINETAQTLTGWTRQGALRVPFTEVVTMVDAESHDPVDGGLAQVLGGQPGGPSGSVLLKRRDGSLIPIEDNCTAIRDDAGILLGAVLVFRDITARRTLEAASEERVRCYQAMLDSIGDGFIALDETVRFVYANRKAAALLGIGNDDLQGRVLWGEMPGLSNSRMGKRLIRAMRDKLPLEMEDEYGGTRLALRAYPASSGLTIYLADVTVHRALSGEPSPSDERIQRSLRAAGAATWEYDMAHRRMEWSETAQQIFGGAEAACPPELLEQMTKGPGTEFHVVVNGQDRWLSWVGQPARTADGERRISGILMDVTARMQSPVTAAASIL